MYVKKFEADTLDEALKSVKKDLGPDAIILKTTSNKGIKGALRKKVQVTAAISEKSYGKKSKVDQILSDEMKEKFYKNPSSSMSQTIDGYEQNRQAAKKAQREAAATNASENNYGSVSLNRSVQTVKPTRNLPDLDSFLSGPTEQASSRDEESDHEEVVAAPVSRVVTENVDLDLAEEILRQGKRLYQLEKKLEETMGQSSLGRDNELRSLSELRLTLRTLLISEKFIQKMIKRAHFELSDDEVQDSEVCYDFCLREMAENIKTQMPLFSRLEEGQGPAVTILTSETSSGQSSMAMKLAAIKNDSVVIKYGGRGANPEHHASAKFFGITVLHANTLPEIITQARTHVDAGKSVFIDFKNMHQGNDETKTLIEGVKRSFPHVETLLCLSGIHSEIHNRKIIAKYKGLAQAMAVSHFDLGLSYGEIFNLQFENDLPLVFFGTGPVIPDDLEAASAERLLSRLFHL